MLKVRVTVASLPKMPYEKVRQYFTHYQWKSSNFYFISKRSKSKETAKRTEKTNEIYVQTESPNSLQERLIKLAPNSPTDRLRFLLEKLQLLWYLN